MLINHNLSRFWLQQSMWRAKEMKHWPKYKFGTHWLLSSRLSFSFIQISVYRDFHHSCASYFWSDYRGGLSLRSSLKHCAFPPEAEEEYTAGIWNSLVVKTFPLSLCCPSIATLSPSHQSHKLNWNSAEFLSGRTANVITLSLSHKDLSNHLN